MGEGARLNALGLVTGDLIGEDVMRPGDDARLGDEQGFNGEGTRTGLDIGRWGIGFTSRIGEEVGDKAKASRVELVSATLLGVPDLLGLLPAPFSLISLLGEVLLGEVVGEVSGLLRGEPGVRVSELTAADMAGLEATSVSEDMDVCPVKIAPGTDSLPSLSEEVSQVSQEDSPMS